MKKIMMNKYGFERWPEQDFTDDGSKFTCFRAGNSVRVSKCTYNGEAFIAARIDGEKLPYDVYSKLPHYRALDRLNGVSIESLTDEDLIQLYNDCLAYEKEYTDAENSIVLPTLDEVKDQCARITAKRKAELAEIEQLLSSNSTLLFTKLSNYELTRVQEYLKSLIKDTTKYNDNFARIYYNSALSISFCQPTCSHLKDSYYYMSLLTLINSVRGGH